MPATIRPVAFFLADHAAAENGKLYINGGFWQNIYSATFPAVRVFSVAAVLHVPWRDHHRDHTFVVAFEDADGNTIPARFEGQFRAGTSPDMRVGDFSIVPVAATVANFVLQRPGDYAALLETDGREVARWRFRAVQTLGSIGGMQPGSGSSGEAPATPTEGE